MVCNLFLGDGHLSVDLRSLSMASDTLRQALQIHSYWSFAHFLPLCSANVSLTGLPFTISCLHRSSTSLPSFASLATSVTSALGTNTTPSTSAKMRSVGSNVEAGKMLDEVDPGNCNEQPNSDGRVNGDCPRVE